MSYNTLMEAVKKSVCAQRGKIPPMAPAAEPIRSAAEWSSRHFHRFLGHHFTNVVALENGQSLKNKLFSVYNEYHTMKQGLIKCKQFLRLSLFLKCFLHWRKSVFWGAKKKISQGDPLGGAF